MLRLFVEGVSAPLKRTIKFLKINQSSCWEILHILNIYRCLVLSEKVNKISVGPNEGLSDESLINWSWSGHTRWRLPTFGANPIKLFRPKEKFTN